MNRSLTRMIFAAVLAAITPAAVSAALSDYGVNAFDISVGARPLGMGGAFTAVVQDGNAVFYNPAAQAGLGEISFSFRDAKNLSILQVYPTDIGTIGFGLVSRSFKDLSTPGGLVSNSNSYGTITYAKEFPGYSIGAGLKLLLNEELQTPVSVQNGSGWDLDLSVLAFPNSWLSLGAVLQNALPKGAMGGGSIVWNSGDSEGIPLVVRGGTSARVFGDSSYLGYSYPGSLLLAADLEGSISSGTRPLILHAGAEWSPNESLFLRTGIDQRLSVKTVETGLTLGAGFIFNGWRLDAAMNPSITTGGSLVFSASYVPEESAGQKKKKIRYLKVFSPQDESSTENDRVLVSGEAKGVRAKVNGLDVYVASDGIFSVEVPLDIGKNKIEITGEHEKQKISFSRRVLRKVAVKIPELKRLEQERSAVLKKEDEVVKKQAEIAYKERAKELSEAEKARLEKEKQELLARQERLEKEKQAVEQKKAKAESKKQTLEGLATLGVIQIPAKKEFEAEERITRAELAVWLVRARSLDLARVDRAPFPDVPADSWSAPYIKTVAQIGLMKPFADGKFHPQEGIRESEGMEILKKFDELKR